ncbi:MAG: 50S ribosomal protein L9 [Rhodospirillales bacterium]|nr:50S ribosomal protein L9 [Rhodospirillales bacterium]
MEVILLERIEGLGQMGDEVSVKPGFARNFLLPQKKALRATAQNKSHFEGERVQFEAENLKRAQDAQAVGDKLEGLSVILVRQAGDAGHLYGSVTASDITNAVVDAGFTIRKNQVVLNAPIKSIGLFSVRVNLHPEVFVTVTANIARTTEEATVQAKTGAAVLSSLDMENEKADAEAAAAEALAAAEDLFEEGAAPSDDAASEETPEQDAGEDSES